MMMGGSLFNMRGAPAQQQAPAQQPQPQQQPAQPAQAPMSLMDQMDERHGKWKNGLGLLSHMLMGGKENEYGDADLLAQQKVATAQQTLDGQMGMLSPYIDQLNDDDPANDGRALLAMQQAGVDKDTIGMLAPNVAQQFNTPTYTKGSYEKIDGRWNLVQQADDGTVKYTQMGENFTPSSRMMSGDKVQAGLQEYQTASFGAAQNVEAIDGVLNVMEDVGEEAWQAGLKGQISEQWKELTGTQDPVSMARKQYEGIKTSRAIQNLPPGVASDKDIELVLKPFPTSFTNYEELQDYLRKLKRGEQKIQEYNNFSARYLSNSGMRDGMIDAWDKHWTDLTSEGGRFYEEPKKKAAQQPQQELSPYISAPQQGGAATGGLDQSTEDILKELGI
jgi:hypothetical protein